MNFKTDCVPCLFKQVDEILCLCNADDKARKSVVSRIAGMIKDFKYDCVPPEKAGHVMQIIYEETGILDPYEKQKIESTKMARGYYPNLKKIISKSEDKLQTAVETAISGNIIDYGAKGHFDLDGELDKLFNGTESNIKSVFQYDDFVADLSAANNVLYLLDNCGEIYFDKVLVEQLISLQKRVIAVVRGGPIINDVTMCEAKECGMTELVEVIDTGAALPGIVFDQCNDRFIEEFKKADIVISKGQGNYETLESYNDSKVYFLFKVKCPIVAEHSGCALGSVVLKNGAK